MEPIEIEQALADKESNELITSFDPSELFPQLAELPGPPEKMWLRGTLPPEGTKLLAVVGSRALTAYGREACESLISGLSGYPISIVSGLALGADACAHRSALAAGLHTIAIPGSGLSDEVIGPRTNLDLAHKILNAGGLLLSENEPFHTAYPSDFPSRNRIMVGLSDAVLIIEAGKNSGSLITARLACEYNRELLCVPHRIGDSHGHGAHVFLRQGADHVTESKHILEALRIPLPEENTAPLTLPLLTSHEQIVYYLLDEPRTRDEVIRDAPMSAGEALTALISLELKGVAKEEYGAWRHT
jgi:DNA processing protein